MIRRASVALALLLLGTHGVRAQTSQDAYGAGWSALGGASVAMAHEDSFSSNPAVLGVLDRKSAMFSGARASLERNTSQMLGILPLRRAGFALGYRQTSVDQIPLRNSSGQDLGADTYAERVFTGGAGFKIQGIAFGAAVHAHHSEFSGSALSKRTVFDLGLLSSRNSWNLGASLLNCGHPLDSQARFGFSRTGVWTWGADLVWPLRGSPYAAVSADWKLHDTLSLKGAYRLGEPASGRAGLLNGISAGMSLSFNRMSLDYVFAPQSDLGASHRIALTLRSRSKTDRPRIKTVSAPARKALEPIVQKSALKPVPIPPSLPQPPSASEIETAWIALVQDARNAFSVLSQSVDVIEGQDSLELNLRDVTCQGRGRFSAQSGTLLAQSAQFLKRHPAFPVDLDVRETSSLACADSIETFLQSERISNPLRATARFGEPSARIIIQKKAFAKP